MTDPTPSFFHVAMRQRATRELLPDPVPDTLIERIIEAGTHAPSAMNGRPWHFVVVQDASVRQQIADGARAAWVGFARDLSSDQKAPRLQSVDRWAVGAETEGPS